MGSASPFSAQGEKSRGSGVAGGEKRARVIDNSSAFRMDEGVPLVIPEINPHAVREDDYLISCPNCSAAIMLMAVAPLHRKFKITRIVAATYQQQAARISAMKELQEETLAHLEGRSYQRSVMPHPLRFNLFPHNQPSMRVAMRRRN